MGTRDWSIYPAIDLRHGHVVRLMQGDPERERSYATDPLRVARRWQEAGAEWLHVVNLDGALGESGRKNLTALERIVDGFSQSAQGRLRPRSNHLAVSRSNGPALSEPNGPAPSASRGVRVQFGGGLRDLTSVRRVLEMGVERVVLGTAAVRDPGLVEAALDAYGPRRVAIGIDARGGSVRTHGWREGAGIAAVDLAERWADRGIRWFIFTDVARDGMGSGLNLEATVDLAQATEASVIASGGVASVEDVRRTYQAGLSGVIIGRALYEGQVTLEAALRVASDEA
jgi:phosphoribosylformimino-5-aminoimidazole carboxamide ribotide isomerase